MFSKKKKKIEISAPSNFQHRVHTGFDNESNRFVGLPKQWASLVGDEAGSNSPHRPTPLVDPSAITPTDDVLDLQSVQHHPHHAYPQQPMRNQQQTSPYTPHQLQQLHNKVRLHAPALIRVSPSLPLNQEKYGRAPIVTCTSFDVAFHNERSEWLRQQHRQVELLALELSAAIPQGQASEQLN